MYIYLRVGIWQLAKKVSLSSNQSDVKIDFTVPITACNLMIEYSDFYENNQVTVLFCFIVLYVSICSVCLYLFCMSPFVLYVSICSVCLHLFYLFSSVLSVSICSVYFFSPSQFIRSASICFVLSPFVLYVSFSLYFYLFCLSLLISFSFFYFSMLRR